MFLATTVVPLDIWREELPKEVAGCGLRYVYVYVRTLCAESFGSIKKKLREHKVFASVISEDNLSIKNIFAQGTLELART
eukprot:3814471-Rhodomonas_salina.1